MKCLICGTETKNKKFCGLPCCWKYAKGKTFRVYKKGYHLSESIKEKIAEKAKGRLHSERTKQKLSQLYLGKTYEKIHGPEKANMIKMKIGESLKKSYKKGLRISTVKQSVREKIGQTLKEGYASGRISNKGGIPTIKIGYRKDLGLWMRSSWEANFARILKYLGISFQYEPKRFELHSNGKLFATYLPDFYLPLLNVWVEIKGYMSERDREIIEKFKSEYTECNFIILRFEEYKKIISLFNGIIPNLELTESSENIRQTSEKKMICSDLHGDMQSVAEMTTQLISIMRN